jgi:hypothetical protein
MRSSPGEQALQVLRDRGTTGQAGQLVASGVRETTAAIRAHRRTLRRHRAAISPHHGRLIGTRRGIP